MKTTRKTAAVAVSILALAAVATASRPSRVVIHGQDEMNRCDVTELHAAASQFERAVASGRVEKRDRDRFELALGACVFAGVNPNWRVEEE